MRMGAPVIGFLILAGATVAQDDGKKEMGQLDGEWLMVSGEANGVAMPREAVQTGRRLAKDGET